MKQSIHPEYREVKVICACGEEFDTKAVNKSDEIKVEICSKCHPFYTGKKKHVDSGGRVERFKQRVSNSKR